MANELSQLDTARNIIAGLGDSFRKVCIDNTINFEREAAFAVQRLQENTFLLDVAYSNPDSLRNAVTNVAAIGISLNPARKQAYLVPRKGSNGRQGVCLDISYMGLMHLAQIDGAIFWGKADVVREADEFELSGLDSPPVHKFKPFGKDRGEIIGAYVVVKTTDGDYLTHLMEIGEINAIRDRSEAWKSGKTCPWRTDYAEMVKKTVVKQASKYWPHRDRLAEAIQHLDTDGGEGLGKDITPGRETVPEPKRDDATLALITNLEAQAANGVDAFRAAYRALTEQQKADIGIPERNRIDALAKEAKQPATIEGEATEVRDE